MDIYDINYNILLQSDINSLIEMCKINKSYRRIGQDTNFWINKFNNDSIQLPFRDGLISPSNLKNTLYEWISIYIIEYKVSNFDSFPFQLCKRKLHSTICQRECVMGCDYCPICKYSSGNYIFIEGDIICNTKKN
jgi:hypothetical protein